MDRSCLQGLYQQLYQAYGPQYWWPTQSPDPAFEVMVGAVLTQNTHWKNVERVICTLCKTHYLQPERIVRQSRQRLAKLIRPCGYFNVKAMRLQNLCRWLLGAGGLAALSRCPTPELRNSLLSVNGVGPETADDILLYALDRPVFVIDTYTRRLFSRRGLIRGDEDYETLRARIEQALGADVSLYNEYHALIVRHAKEKCSKQADCLHCRVEAATSRG